MARAIRKISRSGIYHVMFRGVNKQRIFEQPDDYFAMLRILKYVQTTDTQRNHTEEPIFFLYAFCLMDNHVHLLIQPNIEDLAKIMKRVTTTYAQYFNRAYERVGHLFQDRYKSEIVEDEEYFYTLLSYIHNNPVKANRCESPSQYLYSSIHEYIRMLSPDKTTKRGLTPIGSSLPSLCVAPPICNLKEAVEAEEKCRKEGKKFETPVMSLWVSLEDIANYVADDSISSIHGLLSNLKAFTQESNSKVCQLIRAKLNWLTADEQDQSIVETLYELTDTHSISEFQQLDKRTMRTALAIVKESGIAVNKLARLTGIPIGVIRYAKVVF